MKDENITVRIYQTLDELEDIREFWQSIVNHPNCDFNFYMTIIRSRPEVKSPCVFVMQRDDRPVGLLIGRIEKVPVELKLGYLNLHSPKILQLTILYGGLNGTIGESEAASFVTAINGLLKARAFESVLFSNIHLDSTLHKVLSRNYSFLHKDHGTPPNPHWNAVLSRKPDDFYKKISKNHRYTLRRQARIFEEAFPSEIIIRSFIRENDVEILCKDTEAIAKKTYQRGIGAGFTHNPEMEARLMVCARGSNLRAYILYLKGAPCAFWIGTFYKDTFYLDFTGYDAKYHSQAPGIYLFFKMIDDLCLNTAATRLDFGFGDADYKKRFGDNEWKEVSIMLFAGTLKGLTLHLARQSAIFISIFINAIFSKDLIRVIKKKWRNILGRKLSAGLARE